MSLCIGISHAASVSWDGTSADITGLTANIKTTPNAWNASDEVWNTTDEVVAAQGSQASFKAAIGILPGQRKIAQINAGSDQIFVGGNELAPTGLADYTTLVGFDTSAFGVGEVLTGISVELRTRPTGDSMSVRWFVEAGGSTYVSDVIGSVTGSAYQTLTTPDATAIEWFAFDKNANIGSAVGASVGTLSLTDADYVGYYTSSSFTADANWHGAYVKTFSTFSTASLKAYSPTPVNVANEVSVNADLRWESGPDTLSYDVYFGTTSPGTFQANQTAKTFDPGTLNYETIYHWRIDSINDSGITTGDVWSFTTEYMDSAGTSQGCFVIEDLNGDCQVDIDDLVLMASQWIGPSCGSESGLVLYWKLNESSGPTAADSSVAEHGGSVVGASWNPEGGNLGGALQFDGTDDYVWSSYQGILGSDSRTCAAWIKTDQPSGQIMTWGDLDSDSHGWGISLDQTGVLRVDVGGGYITGTTVLADDFWHHIAVTSGGSTTDEILLYIDGRIETNAKVVSQSINTEGITTVNMGKYFEGLIDDVRIYNRVLSLQKVWALFSTATINHACGDLNADEIVNLSDIARLAQNWLQSAPPIIISEFLADNESKSPLGPGEILDGNGESSDWIEIHNNSGMVIDIGGWYLTDDSGLKTKWQFPAGMTQLVLQPGAYLIVFASGKTQAENPDNYPYVDPAGYLHTNFSLSSNGEYLGLFAADGVTSGHEYNHVNLGGEYGYPEQETDISYGYYYGEPRYFSVLTPGADNIKGSFEQGVEKPDVNFKGGCYVGAVDVTMNCGTAGAFIRYTTDGTAPSLTNGLEYVGPIHLENLTTLIAKAFKPGLQPSDVRIEAYIFVDSEVASFNSNLPIIVIDTLGVPIPFAKNQAPEVQYIDYRAVIIDTDDVTGRADITGPEHFAGIGQIRYRGESSYQTPDYGRGRGQYAIEIQDEYHQDKEVSLLGMPPESDWILNSEFVDRTMLKGYIAFKWFRDMGHYAPRQKFAEVYLNEDGGEISTSDYRGIFGFREKIKRDENRVDIARLDTSHNLAPKVTGGYIIKNDKADFGDVTLVLETAPYDITLDGVTSVVEPKPLDITTPQKEWIQNYMNEFHAVLWQNTASSFYPGPQAVYTDYINPVYWIDAFFIGEAGYDVDVFRYSSFAFKDRDGKLCAGPPWDFDRGFHARPYNQILPTHPDRIPWRWHQGLQQYPEYRILLSDRWFEHREDVLNTAQNMVHIDQTVSLISEAMDRTIDQFSYTYNYATEISSFKNWISNRLNWMDGYIASNFAERPPIFNPLGSYINQGDSIEMSLPAGVSGTVYYTLNGEDPRLEGGSINPDAEIYIDPGGGPITETITIITEDAAKAVLVPSTNIGTSWTGGAEPYDDSTWTHGIPTTGVTVGGVG